MKKMKLKTDFIYQLPFLKHMTQGQIKKLSHSFFEKKCYMGSFVYNQGDPPQNVYVVVSGNFEIIRTTKNHQRTVTEVPRNLIRG